MGEGEELSTKEEAVGKWGTEEQGFKTVAFLVCSNYALNCFF